MYRYTYTVPCPREECAEALCMWCAHASRRPASGWRPATVAGEVPEGPLNETLTKVQKSVCMCVLANGKGVIICVIYWVGVNCAGVGRFTCYGKYNIMTYIHIHIYKSAPLVMTSKHSTTSRSSARPISNPRVNRKYTRKSGKATETHTERDREKQRGRKVKETQRNRERGT